MPLRIPRGNLTSVAGRQQEILPALALVRPRDANVGDPAEGGQMQNVGRMNLEQRLLAAAGTEPL